MAKALSRFPVRVEEADQSEAAWTDGEVIYLDRRLDRASRAAAVTVQAALLAAGSLDRRIVRQIRRNRKLADRYLAFEGGRALAALAGALPPGTDVATLAPAADSAEQSLAFARGRGAPPPLPASFGALRPRAIVGNAPAVVGAEGGEAGAQRLAESRKDVQVAEFSEAPTHEAATLEFSSAGTRGGIFGRFLQRALGLARQTGASGALGADAPTHMLANAPDPRARGAFTNAKPDLSGTATGSDKRGSGLVYPEWHGERGRYREGWCTVCEVEEEEDAADVAAPTPRARGVRRALSRLGVGIDSVHRQTQGDDIDIDAVIEGRISLLSGAQMRDDIYIANQRRRRDLSVLVLLDVSGSTRDGATLGGSIHEEQQRAAAAIMTALHQLGDRTALYMFRSQGRGAVQVSPIKRFDDRWDGRALRRLHGIKAGGYSRLGAAVRHGAALLKAHGATPRKLLVVLSDGLAYDHGYELEYGFADVARSLDEARGDGIGCVCVSVGSATDAVTLGRVFGSAAHAVVPATDRLDRALAPLFRAGLRSAELRRNMTSGVDRAA